MLRVICFISIIVSVSLVPAQDTNKKKSDRKIPKPRFRISKETTRILGPLTKDGYIDYAAALNAHYGKGVLKNQNAATLYFSVVNPKGDFNELPKKFFYQLGIPVPKKKDYFRNFERFLKFHYKLSDQSIALLSSDEKTARKRPWTVTEFPEVSAWVKSNEKQLKTIAEASQRKIMFAPTLYYGGRTEGLLMSSISPGHSIREFGYALEARAMLHLGHGNHDLAWEDLMTMQRFSHHIAQGASIMEWLVGFGLKKRAIEGQLVVLQHSNIDSAMFQRYLHDLLKLPPLPTITKKFDLFERFSILDTVQYISRDDEASTLRAFELMRKQKKLSPRVEQLKEPIDWNVFLKLGNEYFDEVALQLQQSKKEPPAINVLQSLKKVSDSLVSKEKMQKRVDQAKTKREKSSIVYRFVWLGFVLPEIHGMKEAEYRRRQSQSNLIIALALAAYKNDHKKYPEKLAELSPKYLAKIPNDLYTGKPLKYKSTKNGYLLYSVGLNGRDDGGKRERHVENGADDIAIEMPLPKEK